MDDARLAELLRAAVEGAASLHLAASGHEIFRPGSAWCAHGVRDPSLLVDPGGRPVVDADGRHLLYFNGRSAALQAGGTTSVGLAKGSVESGWETLPGPVFDDGTYAAQGSVVRVASDDHRMYYSADTLAGFRMATSVDGVRWARVLHSALPTPPMFGLRRMGLPYVTRAADAWYMVFEGMAPSRFAIYMARSDDGLSWQAVNDGRPIYRPDGEAWDSHGQANPSLYALKDEAGAERFFILYNGCAEPNAWNIGAMAATAVSGPWQAVAGPLLDRASVPRWRDGRLEGARLFPAGDRTHVVFFALPTSDSYAGGGLHLAELKSNPAPEPEAVADVDLNLRAEQAYNDALAKRYFDVWDTYPIQRYTSEQEAKAISRLATAGCDALVLGSGGGRELPTLLDIGARITAVDISAGMIEAGRARYPAAAIEWVQTDVHALPFEDRSADLIVCLGAVFNYLHSPPVFLDEVRRVLRPAGAALFAVLNAEHPSEADGLKALKDGRLRRAYRLGDLQQLFAAAGLTIRAVQGVRHLVDMLPAQWNRSASDLASPGPALLAAVLAVEPGLSEHLPASQAKFMLIEAVVSQ